MQTINKKETNKNKALIYKGNNCFLHVAGSSWQVLDGRSTGKARAPTSREVSSLWSRWGSHKPSSPFLCLCWRFLVQIIPQSRPTDPCPSDWRRVIWWLVGEDYSSCWSLGGQLHKGLNSLVILGAWLGPFGITTIDVFLMELLPAWLALWVLLWRRVGSGLWLGHGGYLSWLPLPPPPVAFSIFWS